MSHNLWGHFVDQLNISKVDPRHLDNRHAVILWDGSRLWFRCKISHRTLVEHTENEQCLAGLCIGIHYSITAPLKNTPPGRIAPRTGAASLLSKKGLRYLLYPFISLWIVGGRISPSLTSAFIMELSNSLGTKRGAERPVRDGVRFARWWTRPSRQTTPANLFKRHSTHDAPVKLG